MIFQKSMDAQLLWVEGVGGLFTISALYLCGFAWNANDNMIGLHIPGDYGTGSNHRVTTNLNASEYCCVVCDAYRIPDASGGRRYFFNVVDIVRV
jgi:hypothetical protein